MKNMIKYQDLDLEIVRLENELNQNGDRKNAIKAQQSLKDYQTKLLELNEKTKRLFDEFESYKKVFNQMVDNMEVVNKNLSQKDEKKIDGLIDANDAITNNLMRLEKKISSIVAECSAVQNEYNNIMKNARATKTSLQKYKESFGSAKAETEKKIAEIRAEMDNLSKSVDAKLLAKYKQKRTEKTNVFVAEIAGKCGGCRMEISSAKKSKLKDEGMIECENCGRIIYAK